jgi:hypothetical protein
VLAVGCDAFLVTAIGVMHPAVMIARNASLQRPSMLISGLNGVGKNSYFT